MFTCSFNDISFISSLFPYDFTRGEKSKNSLFFYLRMIPGTYDFDWSNRIINDLLKWQLTTYFRKPVDPEKDGAPNYLEKVKNPIDLSTIKSKLQSSGYKAVSEFMEDIRLIHHNAETYNGENSMITFIAKDIVKWVEDQFAEKCNSYEEEMRHKLHKAMDELNEHLKHEPPLDITETHEIQNIKEKVSDVPTLVAKTEEQTIPETSQEPQTVQETPNESQVVQEAPNESQVVQEAPNEPQVVQETPNEPQAVQETPNEPQAVQETPNEPQAVQ